MVARHRTSGAGQLARATCPSHLGVIVDGALKACRLDCSARARRRVSSKGSRMDLTICSSTTAADRSSFTATRPDSPSHPSGNWRASGAKTPLDPLCSTDRVCVICIVLHLVVLRGGGGGASPDLAGACVVMSWETKSRFTAGAVGRGLWSSLVMSAPAPGRTWPLGVEQSGRSRSHGSCRSCEG